MNIKFFLILFQTTNEAFKDCLNIKTMNLKVFDS